MNVVCHSLDRLRKDLEFHFPSTEFQCLVNDTAFLYNNLTMTKIHTYAAGRITL